MKNELLCNNKKVEEHHIRQGSAIFDKNERSGIDMYENNSFT